MSFFRYPGGKSKLKDQIAARLDTMTYGYRFEYREPFFGGGSIGLEVLQDGGSFDKVWFNDKDLGISCLWNSVIQHPNLLKEHVKDFVPSIKMFDEFKEELTATEPPKLTSPNEITRYGFMKLAVHQTSYSGLGTKSGGPLGGRKEANIAGCDSSKDIKYPIDCRWSPDYLCKKIDTLHKRLTTVSIRGNRCTSLDFSEVIEDDTHDAIIYLDPPYFVKGNALYQEGFTEQDHCRLASMLRTTKHRWLLSYDDCPEVRELYDWAVIDEVEQVGYSITALKDKNTGERLARAKTELLISPIRYTNPLEGIFNVSCRKSNSTTNRSASV